VILAFVVYTGLALFAGRLIVPTTVVGVVPDGTTALGIGDTITAIDGRPVTTWNQVVQGLARAGDTALVATQRGTVAIPLEDRATTERFLLGIDYFTPAVIDSVVPGTPAASVGFVSGDSVVAIAGEPVRAWGDLTRIVGAAAGRALDFEIERAGVRQVVTVTPAPTPVPNRATGSVDTVGRIGAARRNVAVRERVGVVQGIRTGANATVTAGGAVIRIVRDLFVGDVSVRQLGGPIAITKLSVDAARSGVESLFELIAFLSINIAVLNLLPIPILDGGQILMNVIESAKGSPFSLRTREYILRAGLLAIALLFVTVMYNDTRGWIGSLVQSVSRLFGGGA
jgi:regulator of sigma E protease